MRKTATRASNICVFEIKDSRFGRFAQELFSFVHFAAALIQSMMWIDRFFSISFPSEPFRRSLRRWANARNVSFVLFGYVQKWTQSQKLQIFVVFSMIVIFDAFATFVKPLSLLSFDSMICYLQLSKSLNREGARKGTSNVKKVPKITIIAKKKQQQTFVLFAIASISGRNSTVINLFDTKVLCFAFPPTRHHNFFRDKIFV